VSEKTGTEYGQEWSFQAPPLLILTALNVGSWCRDPSVPKSWILHFQNAVLGVQPTPRMHCWTLVLPLR
jgi:hypothetical protein